jgi:F-box and WD-40 domain protein CDC4
MASDQPVPLDSDQNASLASPPSHVTRHSGSRLVHSRQREMDDHERDNLGQGPSNNAFGQFSFAPTTRTTVVTTTTTTTTSFPPLIVKPPRAVKELDARQYPLAASPTPASLRNLRFKLGDKSIIFNEPEDAAAAGIEVTTSLPPYLQRFRVDVC